MKLSVPLKSWPGVYVRAPPPPLRSPLAGGDHDVEGEVAVGSLHIGDQRREVDQQRPSSFTLRLVEAAVGVSLTGSTVIETVSVLDVSGPSQPGPGAPQLSGSPRSVTR